MSRPERRRRRFARPAWHLPRPDAQAFRVRLAAWRTRLARVPADLAARRAELVRGPWPRRLAIAAGGGTLGALVGAAVFSGPALLAAIADHPYFTVTEIVVTPTTHVRAGTLLESAEMRAGTSLWRVDPAALETRLERHPWIRRATVRREFPRRLVVDLAEREPAAILFLDQLFYVDSTGLAFARVGERDPLDLPFVTGVEAAIVADERPYARHAIRQALRLLRSMQAAGLPFRISEVHIERERGITVFPVEPRVALTFGWSGFGTKLARLGRVLQDFRGRESQIREVDLTMGTAAIVRLRQPGAKGKRTRA